MENTEWIILGLGISLGFCLGNIFQIWVRTISDVRKLKSKVVKELNQKMSKTELILLISHIGFILWFYVGYRFGETKAKKRWLKKKN
jgi:UDP-2,3-diacylglucosamine pyrophosphatase LpxH